MKKSKLLTKIIIRGVLISSVLFLTNSTFAGGAGPDAGYKVVAEYKVGGSKESIRDLMVFNEQNREFIPDVTQLPGFKVAMAQLSQLYSYAPGIGVQLERPLTDKNWYFAKFPENDTSVEAERIGRQDDKNIYLSNKFKVLNCQPTCTAEEESKIRLQGELIYHEMWVGLARRHWNKVKEGHPNQNDVENVVGALLSQGKDYQFGLDPARSLSTLLSEFNFINKTGGNRPKHIPAMMEYLKSEGISAQAIYKPRIGIEISYQTDDEEFIPWMHDDGVWLRYYFDQHLSSAIAELFSGPKYSPSWQMPGFCNLEKTPAVGKENSSKLMSIKITCDLNGRAPFDLDASGNLIIP